MSDLGLEIFDMPPEPPPGVLEAVAAQIATTPRLVMPAPTRREVDDFFGAIADDIKRATGGVLAP